MYRIVGADGKEYGPIEADGLRRWIAEGRVNGETRILVEGAAEWKRLSELPEFASTLKAAETAAPVPGPLAAAPRSGPAKTNTLAIVGLVLGLISITCGMCCCQGFPFSVAGLICSGFALAQINQSPGGQEQGRGIAIAGLALSIASLLLGVLLFIFGLAISTPDMIRKIERL